MGIEVKIKKWGNSVGLVVPIETATKLNLKPDETVIVDISKKENVLKELFGSLKFTKPTEQILKEMRRDIESKWLK